MNQISLWKISFLLLSAFSLSAEPPLIVIQQVVNHPALDRTIQGIVDGLQEYSENHQAPLKIRIESAQNNPSLAYQIATKAVNQNAKCCVGVGTLSAQSFAKFARNGQTQLIFSSVTDPLKADLVETLDHPARHTSGVSNFIDVEPQIDFFLMIQPSLKKIGVIYNPGEANSVVLNQKILTVCEKKGLTLTLQAANKTPDVAQATSKLVQSVDAIFISNDSTALSALPVIIQIASAAKIPVYVSDIDAAPLGALAAMGPDQYIIGRQTADLVIQVLAGTDAGQIAVQSPSTVQSVINIPVAEQLHMTLSDDLMQLNPILIESMTPQTE